MKTTFFFWVNFPLEWRLESIVCYYCISVENKGLKLRQKTKVDDIIIIKEESFKTYKTR